jgi:hypothetical protein
MSKASHLNFLLNTHFFVTNISSVNPYFLVCHFLSPAMLFGTSNNPMCHIFLILSYVYIFLSESYLYLISFFSRQFNHCLTGNAFYHIQHIITNAICQRLISQQHNKTTPSMVSQRLHPAAPLLSPCCQPLPSLAA